MARSKLTARKSTLANQRRTRCFIQRSCRRSPPKMIIRSIKEGSTITLNNNLSDKSTVKLTNKSTDKSNVKSTDKSNVKSTDKSDDKSSDHESMISTSSDETKSNDTSDDDLIIDCK